MYYRCVRCDLLDRLGHLEPDEAYRLRLRCENRTRWKFAFDWEGESR